MSSMRNAVSRRNHKERSQPESRQKWGLLEKHKDYSLRAKDYNQKKKKLNILSQKTRERHPDEFAFGMLSADKGVQGKHGRGDQEKNKLSFDTVKLLKTQDSGYLRTVAARGRKEIDRLREKVATDSAMKLRAGENQQKVVFDENGEPPVKKRRIDEESLDEADLEDSDDGEASAVDSDVVEAVNDAETENTLPTSKSRKQLEKQKELSTKLKAQRRRRKLLNERRAAKLIDLKKRQREILVAADQLDLQRAKMARAIGGTNKNGVKFKIRERRR